MADRSPELDGAARERYRIVRQIGAGGMATVHLAEDTRHDRPVALKVLRPEIAPTAGAERFLREIRVTAGLRHPNIVPVLDSGFASGLPYFVMPYIQGETLRERLALGALPVDEAVRIGREIVDALTSAHAQGVIHRDVKPSNILLDEGHAVVADFGIVRALAEAGGTELTSHGMMLGTPGYLAPEQAAGDREVDGRCDIYALGCVLYEMLAGEPPFRAPSSLALVAKHMNLPPPRVTLLRPAVPAWLEEVLVKALAKNPADRYQTARELADALARGASGSTLALTRGPDRGRGRWWRAAWLTGLAAAAASMLLVWQWAGSRPALDPNRIVVFPPRNGTPEVVSDAAAIDVATFVGYALEGTEPLRWIDGGDRLTAEELEAPGGPTSSRKRDIARELGAAFYVDGALAVQADSVSVILRLNDVGGDSVVAQGRGAEPIASVALGRVGLAAMRELLPPLVGPLPSDRLEALGRAAPAAVFHWLSGERSYRESRMDEALERFQRALAEDSSLALAALGGARAAAWNGRYDEAEELVAASLRHERSLPPGHALLARGLSAYLGGRADAGLEHAAGLIAYDPAWAEAWYLLSEIAHHLLPSERALDSVARSGLERAAEARPRSLPQSVHALAADLRARRTVPRGRLAEEALRLAVALDSTFTPPMVHLAEMAIRRGRIDSAQTWIDRWGGTDPGPEDLARLDLQIRCVRDGPTSVAWETEASSNPLRVVQAAVVLLTGAAQAGCAEAGLRAVLDTETAAPGDRWGALLGLNALLYAQRRWQELTTLLDSPASQALRGESLYLLDGAAGGPLRERASSLAERQGDDFGALGSPTLWLRLLWAGSTGDLLDVRRIEGILALRRDAPGTRSDSLLADIARARATMLAAGPAEGIPALASLEPTAPRAALQWQPWESVGAERLILAEALLASGRAREAIAAASLLDHPEPVVYLLHLPGSLELRIRAAEALGEMDLADLYRARLAALRDDAAGSGGRISPPQEDQHEGR